MANGGKRPVSTQKWAPAFVEEYVKSRERLSEEVKGCFTWESLANQFLSTFPLIRTGRRSLSSSSSKSESDEELKETDGDLGRTRPMTFVSGASTLRIAF